jgi:hypothetical protein
VWLYLALVTTGSVGVPFYFRLIGRELPILQDYAGDGVPERVLEIDPSGYLWPGVTTIWVVTGSSAPVRMTSV